MTDSHFKTLERLFQELLPLDPDQRQARLFELNALDPDLAHEVSELLKEDQGSDASQDISDLIRSTVVSLEQDDPLIGSSIGPFTVERRIGAGGFGTVYEASQREPIQRKVALKVIRRGMDSAEIVSRFESERQALARMDHPAIARVFDAGTTEQGQPYFTMELVDGQSLIEACDQRKLSLRQRLELFVQVARAVQHAHQKGVIHRDLKPGNILVSEQDGVLTPKVIDFGIAKAVQSESEIGGAPIHLTRTMQLIGTPEYMSPEQAAPGHHDIDTRSDVYALGAVLYELLTGVTPFSDRDLRQAGLEEVLRILREEDPPRPSDRLDSLQEGEEVARRRSTQRTSLNRSLRGDLDWIVMKALEKQPARRYDSVGAMGDDIERHLNNETVLAARPSSAYRLRKFVQRNRGTVVAAGLILVALAGGLVAALIGMRQAQDERQRALRAESEQRIEAKTANEISDFLVGLFTESVPDRPNSGDITARELLDVGAERIRTDLADQPDVRARLLTLMGRVYGTMDLQETERELVEEGLEIRRSLHSGDHDDLADSYHAMGAVHYRAGALELARESYQAALEMNRRLHGERSLQVAGGLKAVATVERFLNELDSAEQNLFEALEIYTAEHGRSHPTVVDTRGAYAGVLMAQGKSEQAEAAYRAQIEDCNALYGELHACGAEAMSDLAVLLKNKGEYDQAEPLYLRTLEIKRAVYGETHGDVAQILNNIATFYSTTDQIEKALDFAQQSVAVREAVNPDSPQAAMSIHVLSGILLKAGRAQEALAEAQRAHQILGATAGEKYWVTYYVRSNKGLCLSDLGRREEAEQELAAAAAGLREVLGEDHRYTQRAIKRLEAFRAE